MMEQWIVTFTCANGHSEEVKLVGEDERYARIWAGLLDGSSELYQHPPGPDSPLCKCGICGATLTSSVRQGPDVPEEEITEAIRKL